MELLIERGTYSDLDEIEHLYNEVNEALEMGINYPGWKKGVYPIREDAIVGIDNNALFIARIDNKIVGSIILSHTPEKGYDSAQWQFDGDYSLVYVIHTFVVHPNYTKSGIGTRLLDFAECLGMQNHMKAIRLDVYENNIPAIKLYEQCGYQYIATVDLGLGKYGLDWFRLYEKVLQRI